MNITVGGLPGTGTSTLSRLLRDKLDMEYIYAGQIFRDQAKARGLSLAEFGLLCQHDPSVDQSLDDEQVRLLTERKDIILEGRLSGWLASRNALPAHKVWITCDEGERIRRITERDGGDEVTQRTQTEARESSEADRYRRYYGIELHDTRPYDQVLDSTSTSPELLAEMVVAALRTV